VKASAASPFCGSEKTTQHRITSYGYPPFTYPRPRAQEDTAWWEISVNGYRAYPASPARFPQGIECTGIRLSAPTAQCGLTAFAYNSRCRDRHRNGPGQDHGRFTPERKLILDTLRDELRGAYLPILFDFEKPWHRDLSETVSTLAHMARFVIADLTDPMSIQHELMAFVPDLTSVPVQPLLLASAPKYAMFDDLRRRYSWVLEPFVYKNRDHLLAAIADNVIGPAEAKAKEQTKTASSTRS
jgi:hypothetical protein